MGSKPALSTTRKNKRSAKRPAAKVVIGASLVSVRKIADDFLTGWCMVEVVMNSLNNTQKNGHPEGVVLKHALDMLWPVNEHLTALEAQLPSDEGSNESSDL